MKCDYCGREANKMTAILAGNSHTWACSRSCYEQVRFAEDKEKPMLSKKEKSKLLLDISNTKAEINYIYHRLSDMDTLSDRAISILSSIIILQRELIDKFVGDDKDAE